MVFSVTEKNGHKSSVSSSARLTPLRCVTLLNFCYIWIPLHPAHVLLEQLCYKLCAYVWVCALATHIAFQLPQGKVSYRTCIREVRCQFLKNMSGFTRTPAFLLAKVPNTDAMRSGRPNSARRPSTYRGYENSSILVPIFTYQTFNHLLTDSV